MTVTNFPVLTHRLKLHNHRNIWGKIEAELSVVSTFWLMTREVNLVANNEHLIELQKGVSNWNAWRSRNLRLQIDLKEANLAYAEVSKADFNEADLSLANLGGANLIGANLREANLNLANLRDADIHVARLDGAILDTDVF